MLILEVRFRSQAQCASYQQGLRGSTEHNGRARLAVRLQGMARFSLQWRCLVLPQLFLLVLYSLKTGILIEICSCSSKPYKVLTDGTVLMTILLNFRMLFTFYFPLPCSTGMYLGIFFARYQTIGVKYLHFTPCSAAGLDLPQYLLSSWAIPVLPPLEEEGKQSLSISSRFG